MNAQEDIGVRKYLGRLEGPRRRNEFGWNVNDGVGGWPRRREGSVQPTSSCFPAKLGLYGGPEFAMLIYEHSGRIKGKLENHLAIAAEYMANVSSSPPGAGSFALHDGSTNCPSFVSLWAREDNATRASHDQKFPLLGVCLPLLAFVRRMASLSTLAMASLSVKSNCSTFLLQEGSPMGEMIPLQSRKPSIP